MGTVECCVSSKWSLIYAGMVKSEQQTVNLNNILPLACQVSLLHADDQQGLFLYKLDVEY